MILELKRYSKNDESTLGLLFINRVFFCYTIEDTYQKEKIAGKTHIPRGIYRITLRNEGGMTKKYKKRFPGTHRGMLWLRNVLNFEYVYIHIGNKSENSEGCILVGDTANNNQIKKGLISSSTVAYIRLYKKILKAIDDGESVNIIITNEYK